MCECVCEHVIGIGDKYAYTMTMATYEALPAHVHVLVLVQVHVYITKLHSSHFKLLLKTTYNLSKSFC